MRKIAIAMAKGGVGKTTTAVNLAHCLALMGKKTLLVDCDTQSQVSTFLGITPVHGLFEFVTGTDENGNKVLKRDAIFPARKNLWVLSGGIKLVMLKNRLGEQPAHKRHAIFKKALVPKNEGLDYLIFDCSPGWDILSVNILMAANEVLCPVALQGPCFEGLKTFFSYLVSAQKLNQYLQLKYVLPTMYDRRTKHSDKILIKLQRLFTRQICSPIHHNVKLSEAPIRGKSIFEYAKSAASAKDYENLSRRLIDDGIRQEQSPGFFQRN